MKKFFLTLALMLGFVAAQADGINPAMLAHVWSAQAGVMPANLPTKDLQDCFAGSLPEQGDVKSMFDGGELKVKFNGKVEVNSLSSVTPYFQKDGVTVATVDITDQKQWAATSSETISTFSVYDCDAFKALSEPGDYAFVIPTSFALVDGEPAEGMTLNFKVIEASLKYAYSVQNGVAVKDFEGFTITGEGAETIKAGTGTVYAYFYNEAGQELFEPVTTKVVGNVATISFTYPPVGKGTVKLNIDEGVVTDGENPNPATTIEFPVEYTAKTFDLNKYQTKWYPTLGTDLAATSTTLRNAYVVVFDKTGFEVKNTKDDNLLPKLYHEGKLVAESNEFNEETGVSSLFYIGTGTSKYIYTKFPSTTAINGGNLEVVIPEGAITYNGVPNAEVRNKYFKKYSVTAFSGTATPEFNTSVDEVGDIVITIENANPVSVNTASTASISLNTPGETYYINRDNVGSSAPGVSVVNEVIATNEDGSAKTYKNTITLKFANTGFKTEGVYTLNIPEGFFFLGYNYLGATSAQYLVGSPSIETGVQTLYVQDAYLCNGTVVTDNNGGYKPINSFLLQGIKFEFSNTSTNATYMSALYPNYAPATTGTTFSRPGGLRYYVYPQLKSIPTTKVTAPADCKIKSMTFNVNNKLDASNLANITFSDVTNGTISVAEDGLSWTWTSTDPEGASEFQFTNSKTTGFYDRYVNNIIVDAVNNAASKVEIIDFAEALQAVEPAQNQVVNGTFDHVAFNLATDAAVKVNASCNDKIVLYRGETKLAEASVADVNKEGDTFPKVILSSAAAADDEPVAAKVLSTFGVQFAAEPYTEEGEYSVTIPAQFLQVGDAYLGEYKLNFELVDGVKYILSVADGETIQDFTQFTVTAKGADKIAKKTGTLTAKFTNEANVTANLSNSVSYAENVATVKFTYPPVGKGKVQITIPEGFFTDGATEPALSPAFDVTVNVGQTATDFVLTTAGIVYPAASSSLAATSTTLRTAYMSSIPSTEGVILANAEDSKLLPQLWYEGKLLATSGEWDANGVNTLFKIYNGTRINFNFPTTTVLDAGDYELVIPAGAITINGVPNAEFRRSYTKLPATVAFAGTVVPEMNTAVDKIGEIVLTYNNAKAVSVNAANQSPITLSTPDGTVEISAANQVPGYTLSVVENKTTNDEGEVTATTYTSTITLKFADVDYTKDGIYTLNIPAKFFFLGKDYIDAVSAQYVVGSPSIESGVSTLYVQDAYLCVGTKVTDNNGGYKPITSFMLSGIKFEFTNTSTSASYMSALYPNYAPTTTGTTFTRPGGLRYYVYPQLKSIPTTKVTAPADCKIKSMTFNVNNKLDASNLANITFSDVTNGTISVAEDGLSWTWTSTDPAGASEFQFTNSKTTGFYDRYVNNIVVDVVNNAGAVKTVDFGKLISECEPADKAVVEELGSIRMELEAPNAVVLNSDCVDRIVLKLNGEQLAAISGADFNKTTGEMPFAQLVTGGIDSETGNTGVILGLQFAEKPYTSGGEYTVTIPQGFFLIGVEPNAEYTLTYTIEDRPVVLDFADIVTELTPDPEVAQTEVNVVNVKFQTKGQLVRNEACVDKISLSKDNEVLASASVADVNKTDGTYPNVTLTQTTDEDGNYYTTANVQFAAEAYTAAGVYKVFFPEGFFVVGRDYIGSQELAYTIKAAGPVSGPQTVMLFPKDATDVVGTAKTHNTYGQGWQPVTSFEIEGFKFDASMSAVSTVYCNQLWPSYQPSGAENEGVFGMYAYPYAASGKFIPTVKITAPDGAKITSMTFYINAALNSNMEIAKVSNGTVTMSSDRKSWTWTSTDEAGAESFQFDIDNIEGKTGGLGAKFIYKMEATAVGLPVKKEVVAFDSLVSEVDPEDNSDLDEDGLGRIAIYADGAVTVNKESKNNIVLTLNGKEIASITPANIWDGASEPTYPYVTIVNMGSTIIGLQFAEQAYTEAGVYTVTIPQGFFNIGDDKVLGAKVLTYKNLSNMPAVSLKDAVYTSSPAEGAYVTSFPSKFEIKYKGTLAKAGDAAIEVKNAAGSVVASFSGEDIVVADATSGSTAYTTITLTTKSAPTEEGVYTLCIPDNLFILNNAPATGYDLNFTLSITGEALDMGWQKVKEFTGAGTYYITNADNKTMNTSFTSSPEPAFGAAAATLVQGTYLVGTKTYQWTFEATEGGYFLKSSGDKYVVYDDLNGDLYFCAAANVANYGQKAVWNVEINESGAAVIKNVGNEFYIKGNASSFTGTAKLETAAAAPTYLWANMKRVVPHMDFPNAYSSDPVLAKNGTNMSEDYQNGLRNFDLTYAVEIAKNAACTEPAVLKCNGVKIDECFVSNVSADAFGPATGRQTTITFRFQNHEADLYGDYELIVPSDMFTRDGGVMLNGITYTYKFEESVAPSVQSLTLYTTPAEGLVNLEETPTGLGVITLTTSQDLRVNGSFDINGWICLYRDDELDPVATIQSTYGVEVSADDMAYIGMPYVRLYFGEGDAPKITEGGKYRLEIPNYLFGNAFDGSLYEGAVFNFEIEKKEKPAITWTIEPAADEVEALSDIIVKFENCEKVELTGKATLSDGVDTMEIEPWGDPSNTLWFMLISEVKTAGNWTLNIPAGALTIDGEAFDQAITRTWTVKPVVIPELPKPAVNPAEGEITDVALLNNIVLTLEEGAVAVAGEEYTYMVTLNPVLEEGLGINVASYDLTVDGNKVILTANPAITELENGNYRLVLTAGAFSANGAVSGNYEYNYTVNVEVVKPELPKPEASLPATSNDLADLNTVTLTLAEGAVATVAENAAAELKNAEGAIVAIYSLAADGNKVVLTASPALTELPNGNYTLVVAAGSFETAEGVAAEYEYAVAYTKASGIAGIEVAPNYTVYTMEGACVVLRGTAEDLKQLESGLYIINGKKALVRK